MRIDLRSPSSYVRRGKQSARIYRSIEWVKARKLFLKYKPYCEFCRQRGKRVKAEIVDHIRPHKGDPRIFWNRRNWQGLCRYCHNIDKRRLDWYHEKIDEKLHSQYEFDDDGWIKGIKA